MGKKVMESTGIERERLFMEVHCGDRPAGGNRGGHSKIELAMFLKIRHIFFY